MASYVKSAVDYSTRAIDHIRYFTCLHDLFEEQHLRAQISALLDLYAEGIRSEEIVERLMKVCHRIAVLHLDYSHRRYSLAAVEGNHRSSISGEALSCIARLFCPINQGGATPLSEAWLRFRCDNRHDERGAVLHFVNFVRTVVGQQRSEMLRAYRPQEFKIRRNMRLHLANSGRYGTVRCEHGWIIINKADYCPVCSPVPRLDLRDYCYSEFRESDSLPRMINKAMTILQSQRFLSNCVGFEDLARCIIEYRALILAAPNSRPIRAESCREKYVERLLRRHVQKKIGEKILTTYLNRGKIEKATARAYLGAMMACFLDTYNHGSAASLYFYLSQEIPGLSEKTFRKRHKNRLAYLSGELRQIIQETAEHMLGNLENT
jgi:hypothetical protein